MSELLHSCLYTGRVRHRRLTPISNAFTYSAFWAYLDLSELDQVFADRWLWSTSHATWARFDRADHLLFPDDVIPASDPSPQLSRGYRPTRSNVELPPLDNCVRQLVHHQTGRDITGPIRLLTQMRVLGYLINPVSFYYCFDATGQVVEVVVAEVNNTPWGERHCYVLDSRPANAQRLRFEHAKQFHVSPFMDLNMQYRWWLTPPRQTLSVHIENWRDDACLFDCTLHLQRREISTASLATELLRHPFMTGKVAAAIYWQALKLWWKRCPFVPHPNSKTA